MHKQILGRFEAARHWARPMVERRMAPSLMRCDAHAAHDDRRP